MLLAISPAGKFLSLDGGTSAIIDRTFAIGALAGKLLAIAFAKLGSSLVPAVIPVKNVKVSAGARFDN